MEADVLVGHAADAIPRKPIMRRLETAVAWIVVVLAWCAGMLGLVGPLLGGQDPGLPGPVGFATEIVVAMWVPVGGLTALLLIAVLLRRLWRPAIALTPVVLLLLLPELWSMLPVRAPDLLGDSPVPVLRIAAVNLAAQNRVDPHMEESLRQLDADVLVLSELTSTWAEQLTEWFAGDYPHRWQGAAPDREGYIIDGFRIAVWSRIPPAGEHEVLLLRGYNPQLRVPLRWDNRTFMLYGVHPRNPYPYVLHAGAWNERRQLLDWIRPEKLPTVVAGDFNSPPRSAFLRRLHGLGLSNASEVVCGRAPVTWPMYPARLAPFRVALDHVMHSDPLTAVGFQRGTITNSDHAPVVAELTWHKD